MNQKCKVCGEPAAGFHFGAFTCEGCKSFFGRTYSNVTAIGECKNGGQCVINKKNRTSCKACRLRKCLLVGMSKSGSRYGRRSNWFKIHCLLQEQTGMDQPLPGMFGSGPSSNGERGRVKEEETSSSRCSESPVDDEMNSDERMSPAESSYSYKRSSSSPQASLLAIASAHQWPSVSAPMYHHHPARTSSPKLSESHSRHHQAAAEALLYHHHSSVYDRRSDSASPDSAPEQESPIDLSCKSSSSSPLMHQSSSLCHIRAEILTGLHHQVGGLREESSPLDLTTKG